MLLFDCAASGEIGSSPVMYRILGQAVTRLPSIDERDDGAVRQLLADILLRIVANNSGDGLMAMTAMAPG